MKWAEYYNKVNQFINFEDFTDPISNIVFDFHWNFTGHEVVEVVRKYLYPPHSDALIRSAIAQGVFFEAVDFSMLEDNISPSYFVSVMSSLPIYSEQELNRILSRLKNPEVRKKLKENNRSLTLTYDKNRHKKVNKSTWGFFGGLQIGRFMFGVTHNKEKQQPFRYGDFVKDELGNNGIIVDSNRDYYTVKYEDGFVNIIHKDKLIRR